MKIAQLALWFKTEAILLHQGIKFAKIAPSEFRNKKPINVLIVVVHR